MTEQERDGEQNEMILQEMSVDGDESTTTPPPPNRVTDDLLPTTTTTSTRNEQTVQCFLNKSVYQEVIDGYDHTLKGVVVALAFGSLNSEPMKFSLFEEIVEKHKQVFEKDGNFGLILRMKYKLIQSAILKLADLYSSRSKNGSKAIKRYFSIILK